MPFIVLEGLDGAGKSTQVERITAFMEERGVDCQFLHFPRYGAPIYGEMIGRFLRGEFGTQDEVDPYLVAILFAGDRALAAPTIKEWLKEGKYVITDRYVYSNVAFQCAKLSSEKEQGRLREWILDLEFNHNKLPKPDISLFLDVPFEFTRNSLTTQRDGDDRSYLQGAQDIHEQSLELQQRVRKSYLESAKLDEKLMVVDCSDGGGRMDSPSNIFSKIEEHIKKLF